MGLLEEVPHEAGPAIGGVGAGLVALAVVVRDAGGEADMPRLALDARTAGRARGPAGAARHRAHLHLGAVAVGEVLAVLVLVAAVAHALGAGGGEQEDEGQD